MIPCFRAVIHDAATRTLEFDRIVDAVTGARADAAWRGGAGGARAVDRSQGRRGALQAATSETVSVSRAASAVSAARRRGAGRRARRRSTSQGRPLEPLQLRMVADFVDSVDQARAERRPRRRRVSRSSRARRRRSPRSRAKSRRCARRSIRAARCSTSASPELSGIRDELRQKRQQLRGTLEQFTRGSDTSKYLQDEVITERNGRFVLMVRAEHRGNVPGIVHGSSASGARLFLEPAATVEINNDIVELEEREREEILRILLELTDRFRARPADLTISRDVARRARRAAGQGALQLDGQRHRAGVHDRHQPASCKAARHPLLERAGAGRRAARSAEPRAAHHRARTPAARPSRSRPPGCSR